MKNRLSLLAVLTLSTHLCAKDFIIGIRGDEDPTTYTQFLPKEVEVIQVFKNLKMIAVNASNLESIRFLQLDPNISFVEEAKDTPAPQKFIETAVKMDKEKADISFEKITEGIKLINSPKVWENHTKGQGVKILVLDSGLDINHPDIKANFLKGRNFLNPIDGGYTDTDIKDETGHGTHVAGTIAASSSKLLGVAPEAKILMAKVCNSGCPTIAVLAGVEWGIQEKVGVMNLSLGGSSNFTFAREVYKKAEENNIVVVAATGNDGKYVSFFPASFETNLAVGAVDFNKVITSFSNWSDELDVMAPGKDIFSTVPMGTGRVSESIYKVANDTIKLNVNNMSGSGVGSLTEKEIVYVDLGTEEDFKTKDLKGKIALIKRGDLKFVEKLKNAIKAEAVGAIVFNHEVGSFNGTLGEDLPIVTGTIDQASGEQLKKILMSTPNLKISLIVTASNYQKNNGTSMAAPHVSGVAALIRAMNPALTAIQVKEIIKKSSIMPADGSPLKYGKGVVNAFSAVEKSLDKTVTD